MKRWEMSRQEWNASYSAYMHTHTGIRTYTHQRRTTLVVDLQDKYYSEKLDYRYRPPPNANSCASADRPKPTDTHVTCVRACESASEKLSRLSPQSSPPPTFNLSLFSSRRQTAIPHEFSVYHNHAEWCRPLRWIQTNHWLQKSTSPYTNDDIAKRDLWGSRNVLYAQTFAEMSS